MKYVYRLILSICLCTCVAGKLFADGIPCELDNAIGWYDTPNEARDVAYQNNYAYVADGDSNEIYILDVSDPSTPTLVTIYQAAGDASLVDVENGVMVIANSNLLLEFVDVSDPTNPIQIETRLGQIRYLDLVIRDGYAYLTSYAFSRCLIYDIQDPQNIQFVSSIPDVGLGSSLSLLGDRLYLADYDLKIIDVADPTNATLISEFEILNINFDVVAAFTGNDNRSYLFTAGSSNIYIFDCTDPHQLTILYQKTDAPTPDRALVIGTTAYLAADGSQSIQVMDFSDPTNPFLLAEHHARGYPHNFDFDDQGRMYIAANTGGLQIIDPNQHATSAELSYYYLDSLTRHIVDIAKSGHIILLASELDGLVLIDGVDRRHPERLSSIPFSQRAVSVSAKGNLAYVAANFDGIRVIDFSDPHQPIEITTLETTREARETLIADGILYVIDNLTGIRAYALDTPEQPNLLGISESFRGRQLAYSSGYLFGASDSFDQGVHIFDISDPAKIHAVNIFATENRIMQIEVKENFLFAMHQNLGITVYDISDVLNPIEIAFYPYDRIDDMEAVGDLLYIAAHEQGVQILDTSNITQPELVGWHIPRSDQARTLLVDGPVIHVGHGRNRLSTLDIRTCNECPADFTLDGQLTYHDVQLFIVWFTLQNPHADLNHDQVWNFFDVQLFLHAYLAGC